MGRSEIRQEPPSIGRHGGPRRGGTIDAGGRYVAGQTPGRYNVTATFGDLSYSAVVTIAPQAASSPTNLEIRAATYGSITLQTIASAHCTVTIALAHGVYGEIPSPTVEGVADGSGALTLRYSAPRIPSTTGNYSARCTASTGTFVASRPFDVVLKPISATNFVVHVRSGGAAEGFAQEPSLVPLRDSVVTKIRDTLAAQWSAATRGLGTVRVVDDSADIVVTVLAQLGISVNRPGPDGSDDVLIYVNDQNVGVMVVENGVATTLHELGHIWCCQGPGTADGHWLTKEVSLGLFGIDQYGRMTDPVTCVHLPSGVFSCPNRFSDRELMTMFSGPIPTPAPDACIIQSNSLRQQIDALDVQLTTMLKQITDEQSRIDDLDRQIQALVAPYPGGLLPPAVYDSYIVLHDQEMALISIDDGRVASYRALRDKRNGLANQLNALPC